MSLQSRLGSLITAIGADIKSLQSQINGLSGGSYPWSEENRSSGYNNSTTSLTDVFTGFVPAPSTRYIVDIIGVCYAAAATTGVQLQLTGPTTGLTRTTVRINTPASASTDLLTHTNLNSAQAAVASLVSPGGIFSVQAILDFNASAGAQNVRLQAKSEVASSQVTIAAGSIMRWRTV